MGKEERGGGKGNKKSKDEDVELAIIQFAKKKYSTGGVVEGDPARRGEFKVKKGG